jgi:hypothetical protein
MFREHECEKVFALRVSPLCTWQEQLPGQAHGFGEDLVVMFVSHMRCGFRQCIASSAQSPSTFLSSQAFQERNQRHPIRRHVGNSLPQSIFCKDLAGAQGDLLGSCDGRRKHLKARRVGRRPGGCIREADRRQPTPRHVRDCSLQ